MGYIPQTNDQKKEMLAQIGAGNIEELFASIPASVKKNTAISLEEPLEERAIVTRLEELLEKNFHGSSFCGFGLYRHFIPEAVNSLASIRNFVTSYTPYQPEVAQGTLQTLFEFQSQVALLTSMDVANASLYDGATALVEALRLALRQKPALKKDQPRKIVVSCSIHPIYLDVLKAYFNESICKDLNIEFIFIDTHASSGIIEMSQLSILKEAEIFALQSPNVFGLVEESLPQIRGNFPHLQILLGINELHSCALMSEEFKKSADIVWAEAQSLGIPVSFGGPSLGLIAAKKEYIRQMPGRLIGKTSAKNSFGEDTSAFVITLATREQHIRREKATSNICSNQTLMAVRACIYMAQLGWNKLQEVMALCCDHAAYFREKLAQKGGSELIFSDEHQLHEVCWRPVGKKSRSELTQYVEELQKKSILAGAIVSLNYNLPSADSNCAIVSYFSDELTRQQIDELLHHI